MEKICIFEVGPRDGLQNERIFVPTQQKIELVNMLSEIGFERIEVTSFVSPKWVPQMADADLVMKQIKRAKNTSYAALTPNLIGYEKALESAADEVAIFCAASETFSQKNINCSIAESLERFKLVVAAAQRDNIPVRGYVSCVAGCPYEGDISPHSVAKIVQDLLDLGCYEVSLGDTIGVGTPQTIATLLSTVVKQVDVGHLAGHYHDTNGLALDNVKVSLEYGLRTFDAAIGGLGGCPYAPGAAGNLSTLKLANMLETTGWSTGLDMEKLQCVEQEISDQFVIKESR